MAVMVCCDPAVGGTEALCKLAPLRMRSRSSVWYFGAINVSIEMGEDCALGWDPTGMHTTGLGFPGDVKQPNLLLSNWSSWSSIRFQTISAFQHPPKFPKALEDCRHPRWRSERSVGAGQGWVAMPVSQTAGGGGKVGSFYQFIPTCGVSRL